MNITKIVTTIHRLSRLYSAAVLIVSALLLPLLAAAQTYRVINLGDLGGGGTIPNSINAFCQVVGYSYTADQVQRAFLWQRGIMTDLGTLGGATGSANAINSAGQIVGSSRYAGNVSNAYLWQSGKMIDIDISIGINSGASAINSSAQVVGTGPGGAFLWQKGVFTFLGTLPGGQSGSAPYGINDHGQVVGWSSTATSIGDAALWQKGVWTDLGTLGGGSSNALGINNAGQVVGDSYTADNVQHAFSWKNGVMTDLGTFGGAASNAYAINNAGQVVGWAKLGDDDIHAFIWQSGVMTDLNNLIQSGSGWVLGGGTGINDAGQIVGLGEFNGQTVAFLLTAPLVANPQTFNVAHNTATAIALTGSDSLKLPLIYKIAASPANGTLGTLNGATGAVSYTPSANFQGTDSFTFTVGDTFGTSSPATVTLKVEPGVPTALAQTVSVVLGKSAPIRLAGTDPDNPPLALKFAIASPPADGSLGTLNAATGAVAYTPNANFRGTDNFTFIVTNGSYVSAAAKVMLNVAPGTPTANPQTVAIAHGTAEFITLTGTDPDSPALPLTFAIADMPAHGILGSLNSATGVVKYSPVGTYSGADSFTFTVSNGTRTSAASSVTLDVAPGSPKANPQTVAIAHGTAESITLTGTDPDSPALPLTFAIVGMPAHGILGSLNSATGVVKYTPVGTYSGIDSFTFTVSNGTNTSSPATVTLKVAPGDPTASAQTVTVPLNIRVTITLTGSDPDVPALKLTFAIATKPAHGVLGSLNTSTGVLVYTPDSKYVGTDSFTFTVTNGTNKSAPATATLNVGGG